MVKPYFYLKKTIFPFDKPQLSIGFTPAREWIVHADVGLEPPSEIEICRSQKKQEILDVIAHNPDFSKLKLKDLTAKR